MATCPRCGTPITDTKRREYCSDACRQGAYRARRQGDGAKRIAELEARLAEAQAEIKRLQAVLDVETRFRLDTQARFFQAWLKKQTFEPGSLYQQLKVFVLAEKALPQKASRAAYEAHLRRLGCKDMRLQAFTELWKAMLLQS